MKLWVITLISDVMKKVALLWLSIFQWQEKLNHRL